ncbi:MAG: hypothetical protein GC200_08105 [Tepidisphaera sp.]|nr:hypothetical protein [Tepidisphaera sp.]
MTRMAGLLAALVAALFLGACAGPPKSSRLSVDDIEVTAQELSAKLTGSDFLANRNADSPRMIVALTKVENLTTDVIPEADEWYIMTRVRASRSMEALKRLKNIVFVVPIEHIRGGAAQASEFDQLVAQGRKPTHEMSATFRSSVRAKGENRTDVYMCDLRITDLTTRELSFADSVEFKKTAVGKAYD